MKTNEEIIKELRKYFGIDQLSRIIIVLKAKDSQSLQEKREIVEIIDLILPMAKGYASEHDVGNNKKIVQNVEELKTTWLEKLNKGE